MDRRKPTNFTYGRHFARCCAQGQATLARLLLIALLVCMPITATLYTQTGLVHAQGPSSPNQNREYPLKAAYLYNFGGYIDWPESDFATPDTPFRIGIVGTNTFGQILQEIESSKRINGRRVQFLEFASPEHIHPCQILFLGASLSQVQREAAIAKTAGAHTLVVGETPGLTKRGAVVNFIVEQNRLRFEINLETAKQRNLKISSKLLSLAKIVED